MAEQIRQAPWIKVRGSLLDSPKLITMAKSLSNNLKFHRWLCPGTDLRVISNSALRCVTLALLVRVWSRARQHGKFVGNDLVLSPFSLSDLDELAEAPGVGEAMKLVGWATENEDMSVTLEDFKAYNVPMSNAERQAAWRGRVTDSNEEVTQSNARTVTKRVTKTETET